MLAVVALRRVRRRSVVDDVRSLDTSLDRVASESDLYGPNLEAVIAKAGGEKALKACGPVYTGAFQTQAVAWYLHLHETDVIIFPCPPGTMIAPALHGERARSALPEGDQDDALDGRELLQRPVNIPLTSSTMATIASRRPAWSLPATVAGSARLLAPLAVARPGAAVDLLRTRDFDVGFWIDEGLSVGIADRPLSDIPAALRLDGSPPLYYSLLHVWMAVFGETETATHALSLVFAVLAVPAAWWAARGLFGPTAGLAAALLAAHEPVPDAVRAGDADVHARGAARAARVRHVRPRLRARRDRGGAPARERRRWAGAFAVALARAALHPQLGAVLRRRLRADLARCCSRRRAAERAPRAASRTGWSASAARCCCSRRGCRRSLFQAQHTGAPWSNSPGLDDLGRIPERLLGSIAQIALLLAAGAGMVALLDRSGGRLAARGRALVALTRSGGRDRAGRVRRLAGLARLGVALPGGRAARRCCSCSRAGWRTPAGSAWSQRCWSR